MSGLTEPQIILFTTHASTNSTFYSQNVLLLSSTPSTRRATLHVASCFSFFLKRRLEVVNPNTGSSEERHIKKRDLTTISRREHI